MSVFFDNVDKDEEDEASFTEPVRGVPSELDDVQLIAECNTSDRNIAAGDTIEVEVVVDGVVFESSIERREEGCCIVVDVVSCIGFKDLAGGLSEETLCAV